MYITLVLIFQLHMLMLISVCQLGFVFGLSMTNALLGFNYFARHKRKKEIVEKAEFQRMLARYLIFNDDIVELRLGGGGAEAARVAAAFAPHVDALQWSSTMSARTFLQFDE